MSFSFGRRQRWPLVLGGGQYRIPVGSGPGTVHPHQRVALLPLLLPLGPSINQVKAFPHH